MTTDAALILPKGIEENIFQYRLKVLLKQNGKPYSGRFTVYERLHQAISHDPEFKVVFENFIVDEISNGRNRQVFLCQFSVESLNILSSFQSIQSNLAANGYPHEDFNKLLDPNVAAGEMVFLSIARTPENRVDKISIAFIRESLIEVQDSEGEPSEKNVIDYVWIDIFPNERYLQIKTRPHSNNYFINQEKSKQDFDYYWNLLKKVFGITFTNMSESKNTLYRIFKVLTEKAEAPYSKKVTETYGQIENKIDEIAQLLELPNANHPVDIPIRVARLFERALILSDLSNYMAYDNEKLGIVDRIDFSDQSGAKVNALSGNEGIEVADIYFDTRETLEELKQLNKLWVRWFLPIPFTETDLDADAEDAQLPVTKIEQVETRLEVYDNRVVIQFLGIMCAPKEVQDHVLSLFRKFETGEIS